MVNLSTACETRTRAGASEINITTLSIVFGVPALYILARLLLGTMSGLGLCALMPTALSGMACVDEKNLRVKQRRNGAACVQGRVHTATRIRVHCLQLHEPELVQHLLRNTMDAAALDLSSQPHSHRRCARGAILCAVCVSR